MSPEKSVSILLEAFGPELVTALVDRLVWIKTAGGFGRLTVMVKNGRASYIETTVSDAAPGHTPPTNTAGPMDTPTRT